VFASLLPHGDPASAAAGRHSLLIIYAAAAVIGFGGAALFACAF
jgi:hypothetical protein